MTTEAPTTVTVDSVNKSGKSQEESLNISSVDHRVHHFNTYSSIFLNKKIMLGDAKESKVVWIISVILVFSLLFSTSY